MKWLLVFAVVGACGQPESSPRAPQQRSLESASAVAAIREARFADAAHEASAVLARDPKNATAAAIRAITTYQQAASHVFDELGAVMEHAEGLHFFDHERGRAAWIAALAQLDAVDRDLATAAADPSFVLDLCLACWNYDWNHSGEIDERDRKFFELEYDGKGDALPQHDPRRRPTFRFDVGDIDWARAMIAFQRAGIELVLAYRWSELDKLFVRSDGERRLVVALVDAGRVKHAHAMIVQGLALAERCRLEYLAETDNEREWVPNPRQSNHAMPLEVNDALFQKWADVIADVRRLLASEQGLSLQEVGAAVLGDRAGMMMPNAYVDVGRMLREPTDVVIDLRDDHDTPEVFERVLRGILGHGFVSSMSGSPLVGRLRHMKGEVDRGEDTFERKLRYLIWLN
jgi:hypothetical protein